VYINENADIYTQDPRFEQALYRFELEENQPAQQFAQVHVSFLINWIDFGEFYMILLI
jgi:hypothetical protein